MEKHNEGNIEHFIRISNVWKRMTFPARPTKTELLLYEKMISSVSGKSKNPRVVILGVTPELRELCLTHDCEIISLDVSNEMISAMNHLMKEKNNPQDNIIQCNWKEIPLKNDTYDLVLGDTALNMDPIEDYEHIVKEVHRILKSDGIFFTKMFEIGPGFKKPDKEEALNLWREGKISFEDFSFYVTCSFLDDNNLIHIHKKTDFLKNIEFTKEEFELVEPLTLAGGLIISVPFKKDLEKLFSRFFTILSKDYLKDLKCLKDIPVPFYSMKARK